MKKKIKRIWKNIVRPIMYVWALVYMITQTMFFNYQPLVAWYWGRGQILIDYNHYGENVFEIFLCTSGSIAVGIFIYDHIDRFILWRKWRKMSKDIAKAFEEMK